MISSLFQRIVRHGLTVSALAAQVFAFSPSAALADFVVINEIFNDPGGQGTDDRDEYIELRGTPGMALDNMYLIFIENEVNLTGGGSAGFIENIFTLGRGMDENGNPIFDEPFKIGSNGFLTLRQKDTLYADPPIGTTDLVNTGTGIGWGSDSTSTVRHSGEGGKTRIENSGFTVMLIRHDGNPAHVTPFLGLDLDQGNDGLDPVGGDRFGWRSAWEIVDSIGIHGEIDEANGRLYGFVNFGQQPTANHEGEYLGVGYEIEMISRWGNSTGHTLADWHATNLSDRTVEGHFTASSGVPDYRQSGGFHEGDSFVESNQYVPYGTPLTTTLGAPNYPLNLDRLPWDYNGDGIVDAADYTVWRNTLGQTGMGLAADGDGSGTVDEQDYKWWKARYGYSWNDVPGYAPSALADSIVVPEPATTALVALSAFGVAFCRGRRPLTEH